jgi:hypothetical protein
MLPPVVTACRAVSVERASRSARPVVGPDSAQPFDKIHRPSEPCPALSGSKGRSWCSRSTPNGRRRPATPSRDQRSRSAVALADHAHRNGLVMSRSTLSACNWRAITTGQTGSTTATRRASIHAWTATVSVPRTDLPNWLRSRSRTRRVPAINHAGAPALSTSSVSASVSFVLVRDGPRPTASAPAQAA